MYAHRAYLVICDADGTLVDAFGAMELAFARHDMDIGDLERFQKRRKLFKYLGGLREFPKNLRRQFGKQNRKRLLETLTDIYRNEATLYPGVAALLQTLIGASCVRVGIVSRNVTREPEQTLRQLLARQGVDPDGLDFLRCIPLGDDKLASFRTVRREFGINPALAFACGDEFRDYAAATGAGMHPFIAAYGFEDHRRLRDEFGIPDEVIARTPHELAARLLHALGLEASADNSAQHRA